MSDYRIQPGDTLWALSRRFNTSVKELVDLNGIENPDLIYAGATLKLPGDSNQTGPANGGTPSSLGLPPSQQKAAAPAKGGDASKPPVVEMPSPNQNERPAGTKIDTVVLHHTADSGTAQDTGRFFQNPSAQVSSHYIVGKDGTIVQSVPDDKRAWHAGSSDFKGKDDVNDFSLGIEIVNRGDNSDPYTDAQYESLSKLLAYQVKTYGISMDRITGHRDVSHEGKTDPSDNFDWNRVRRMVEERLS